MRRALAGALLACFLVGLGVGCGGGGAKDPPTTLKLPQVKAEKKKANASVGQEPAEKIPDLPGFHPPAQGK